MGRHDVSDDQWDLIGEYLTLPPAKTGRPRNDPRQAFNAIVWILRTGAAWRDLPQEYGPWNTAYGYFRLWRDSGAFDRAQQALLEHLEQQGFLDHHQWNLDGTSIRATKAAAGASNASKKSMRRNLPTMLLDALEVDSERRSIS